MATGKSKILIIKATGRFGSFVVVASAKAGHESFTLVRESTLSNLDKADTIEKFKSLGLKFFHGDSNNHESLAKTIKQVDVVISTFGFTQVSDQVKIITAIKEAGNIKVLSLGVWDDADCVHAVEPAKTMFANISHIRRAVEAEGIPYTYASSNLFDGIYLASLLQLGATAPPRDKVVITDDGEQKG